jgi:hypothetical protein
MGDPVNVQPEPIRRAAVMRLQVAHALADRPPPGSNVDQGALSAMLGEIDGLLSEVAALAAAASPDLQPSLESVRNALVKEAIDFSEAAQQIAPAGVQPVAPSAAPARKLPGTRVLTVSAEPEPAQRRGRALHVMLGLAVVIAGGFHGWRWYELQHARVPPPEVTGAPARAIGGANPNGSKFITTKDGKPFTEAEIETFRQREELQGRRVQLVSPDTLISLPANTPPLPINPALVPVATPAAPQRPPGAKP